MQPFAVACAIVKPHNWQTTLDQTVYCHDDQLLHLKICAEKAIAVSEYATRNRLTKVTINELRAFILKDGQAKGQKYGGSSAFANENL